MAKSLNLCYIFINSTSSTSPFEYFSPTSRRKNPSITIRSSQIQAEAHRYRSIDSAIATMLLIERIPNILHVDQICGAYLYTVQMAAALFIHDLLCTRSRHPIFLRFYEYITIDGENNPYRINQPYEYILYYIKDLRSEDTSSSCYFVYNKVSSNINQDPNRSFRLTPV